MDVVDNTDDVREFQEERSSPSPGAEGHHLHMWELSAILGFVALPAARLVLVTLYKPVSLLCTL